LLSALESVFTICSHRGIGECVYEHGYDHP
jgi:hypothetical protein